MNNETVTIKRIGPTSALKVGAAMGILGGAFFFILTIVLVAPTLFPAAGYPDLHAEVNDFNNRVRVLSISALGGAISGAVLALVSAWVYNVALNLTGGLQLEVSFGPDGADKEKGAPPTIASPMPYHQ